MADIIPDHQMPQDAEGRPFEVLLNPLGIITRSNPAQMAELYLGKIAAKRGKPIAVEDFDDSKDMTEWVLAELAKEGMSDLEDILDPSKDRKIKGIATGNRFFMKLHHTAEGKGQSRGGGGYTSEGSPAKGGASGSKRIGMLDSNALLSHGATDTLSDVKNIRGQKNDDYWSQYMAGYNPSESKVPHVYRKFVDSLRASGVNVVKSGSQLNVMALTDKDVDELAGDRDIASGAGVDWGDELKEISGGLFDKAKTGGHGGNRWAAIRLAEPMPNPAMEEPLRHILGLTGKQFQGVISGEHSLANYGTGPTAMKKALEAIDLDKAIDKARAAIASGKKSERDSAVRRLGYLKSAKKLGLHPSDYMLNRVPVLPPAFRPVSMMTNDMPLVDDANYLYKELFEANQSLADVQRELGGDAAGQERLATYNAFKAVTGLGDPISQKSKDKNVQGLLKTVFGSSPKYGTLQRKLISSTVDNVGRAVISPNPDLDMDSVGLPEDKAFRAYEKFLVRRLTRQGMSMRSALEAVKERSPLARKALLEEMETRPVYISRAPVLHKYGVMAFRPRLTKGETLQVSPLIVKGFGADFNGDSCRTPLLPVRVKNKLFLGDFEAFIQSHVMPDYKEETVLDVLGIQTTVFEFAEDAEVYVPGLALDGAVGWQQASHISIHTSHGPDCYQVRTRRGMDAVFTAHHNFMGLDDQCLLVAKKTTEVGEGSLLPVVFDFDTTLQGTVAEGKPDLPLTMETGVFIGHWLGDGSLTGRDDTVSQAGSKEPTLLRYLEEVGSQFSAAKPWYEGNRKSVRWTDKPLLGWFESQFGRGSQHKRLASWCLTAPVEFRQGLLIGLILAEANPQKGHTRMELANRELLLAIKMLAYSLGIPSTLRKGKPARTGKITGNPHAPTWTLRINNFSLCSRITTWPDIPASTRFRTYKREGSHQVWDQVPYPSVVADKINQHTQSFVGGKGRWATVRGERKSAQKRNNFVSAKDRKTAEKRGSCTRACAEKLIEHYALSELGDPVIDRWISFVGNKNLIWDSIEDIRKVDRPDVTYDFHVPGGESFCIDGFFVTHNTMNYHVPSTNKSAQEAYDRMLPSRNLISTSNFKSVVHAPANEYIGGLYHATSSKSERPLRIFRNVGDMKSAYERGDIDVNDRVKILQK